MTLICTSNFSFKKTSISLVTSLIISMTSFCSVATNAAPIYKVVDEKTGQVTFTDSPQPYEQQADKQISQLNITTGNSSDNNASSNNKTANPQQADSEQNTAIPKPSFQAAVNYQLTMIEPSEERAYQRPAQTIIVNLQLQPALQVNNSVVIYLDGKPIARGLGASIATVDLLPGEHSIQAAVMNEFGQALQQVQRTVYVIQNTATIQNQRQLNKQLLAYQRLPWQQKLLLKLRQNNVVNAKK